LCTLTVVGFWVAAQSSQAQESRSETDVHVGVTSVASEKGFTELQKHVLNLCKGELAKAGYPVSSNPDFELLIISEEIQAGTENLVVISVTTTQALPKEILAFNAEKETFYLTFKKKFS
jgi:hypothetical protein